jgi:hypothetical protein
MKKQNQELVPTKLALSATIITITISFLATLLALTNSNLTTITPFLKTLYGSIGYSVSITGLLIGPLYIGIDAFIITWLFAWTYNKLL